MKIVLPKSADALISALDDMVGPAIVERDIQYTWWRIISLYLQGVRNFSKINFESGEVDYDYDEEDGRPTGIPFRWEDCLTRIQVEIGRLSRLDFSPRVAKRAFTLDSMRTASLGQVTLDNMLEGVDRGSIDMSFLVHLVLYGTVGLGHWEAPNGGPLDAEVEIIPPWELLGVPATLSDPTARRAVVRQRIVPYDQLKRREEFNLGREPEKLELRVMPYGSGESMEQDYLSSGGWGSSGLSRGTLGRSGGSDPPVGEKFGELQEFWIPDSRGRLARYIARVGRKLVYDSEAVGGMREDTPMPVGVARYTDIGRFYGLGLGWKIVPFSARMEQLMRALIVNVEDMDRFGYLIYDLNAGITKESFKDTGRPRVIGVERDLDSPVSNLVSSVQPVSSGDIPGRVVQLMIEELDKLTGQGPLYGGMTSGRVESGRGLETLAETGSTHLLPIARSIKDCYSTVYRSMLGQAFRGMKAKGLDSVVLTLTRISSNVAGLMIDPQNGRITVGDATGLSPWGVDISIRSDDPLRGERRKQEALGLLRENRLAPIRFLLMSYAEGWDIPMAGESVWENYVKAVMSNLLLFNDGQTPGTGVKYNRLYDLPEVHAIAVEEFIRTAAFDLASDPVKQAFVDKYKQLKFDLGEPLPSGMPPVEEAAMGEEQRLAGLAQMMQGTGGGPPVGSPESPQIPQY